MIQLLLQRPTGRLFLVALESVTANLDAVTRASASLVRRNWQLTKLLSHFGPELERKEDENLRLRGRTRRNGSRESDVIHSFLRHCCRYRGLFSLSERFENFLRWARAPSAARSRRCGCGDNEKEEAKC